MMATFVWFFLWIIKHIDPGIEKNYELTYEEMYRETFGEKPADGTILLHLADPQTKIHGGDATLLNELIQTDAGKTIYLFSNSDCPYRSMSIGDSFRRIPGTL